MKYISWFAVALAMVSMLGCGPRDAPTGGSIKPPSVPEGAEPEDVTYRESRVDENFRPAEYSYRCSSERFIHPFDRSRLPARKNGPVRTLPFDIPVDTDEVDADHLHIYSVMLESLEGEGVADVIRWAEISSAVRDVRLAWTTEEDIASAGEELYLSVNGAIDLMRHIDDGELELKGKIRVRLPSVSTVIDGEAELIRYFDCVADD